MLGEAPRFQMLNVQISRDFDYSLPSGPKLLQKRSTVLLNKNNAVSFGEAASAAAAAARICAEVR